MAFLFILGIVAGMMVPIQTSINARLGRFTESSFYASTISFFVGSLFLFILNVIFNPKLFDATFYSGHAIDYHWWVGGLLGVCFLTGNLLLLPRLGAALTVVMTVAGQIIMGVFIDTFGLLGASNHPFTLLKAVGILILLFGILLMNEIPKNKLEEKTNRMFYVWLIIGFIFGFAPPLQTTINSGLAQQMHNSLFAALVSFSVGTFALFILTLIFNRSLKFKVSQPDLGNIKPIHFIGGVLGVIFVTSNIILMPFLGAALTTIVAMLGQMLMGVMIDHFGLGVPKNSITLRKFSGLIAIAIGIVLLRLF
ncbi:DMT family transporter [Staphylococcus borealis]|uniref:DMT family transporter n=1 Tax=Staphylococcus borealis TaxID=2742203 RepID=UPI000FF3AF15|nr:DMT family transporter [Staphylococcus borealis]MDM7864230.1 DMT family transporter [Staphylococcus borealis]MDM7883193.1 DMT family transporter [Staphylococcus borealis]RIO91450.1 DMT family transporter [Staphylococcus haemolyticus]